MKDPTVWPEVAIQDFCNPKQWPTISQSSFAENGHPVYGANGRIGYYSSYNHEDPTVLITCRGATCGAVNICEPRSYVTGNAMALDDLDASRVDREYLAHALRHRGLTKAITGTAQPQITRQSLAGVSVPLPALGEQRRIAEALGRAEALRAKRRLALAQLDTLTQSMFEAATTSADSRPVPLTEVATLKRGPFGGALKKEIFVASGYRVYEQGNAIRQDFTTARYFITESKFRAMEAFVRVQVPCAGITWCEA
jgi:type I restriction enzyme S subunit